MYAAVRMQEQTSVTVHGDLSLLLSVCGGITDDGANRLDEANASQTAMVMRRLLQSSTAAGDHGGGGSGRRRKAEMGFGAKGKSLTLTVTIDGQTQKGTVEGQTETIEFHEALFHIDSQWCRLLGTDLHLPPTSCLSSHAIFGVVNAELNPSHNRLLNGGCT
jgi:hypothetical protein